MAILFLKNKMKKEKKNRIFNSEKNVNKKDFLRMKDEHSLIIVIVQQNEFVFFFIFFLRENIFG